MHTGRQQRYQKPDVNETQQLACESGINTVNGLPSESTIVCVDLIAHECAPGYVVSE